MWHPGFKHRQTSNHGRFLPGGKLGYFVDAKCAICRNDRGHLIDRYLISVISQATTISTCHKSFETFSYNNTKKQPFINPPSKALSKKRPPVMSPAPEGVFKKIDLRSCPKKQHPNQPSGTSIPAMLKPKNHHNNSLNHQ